jgi:hypothetical protein
MAVVAYKHICDLCGKPCQPDRLVHLYGEAVFRVGFAAADRPRADICTTCQARPVLEVLEFLAGDQ